NWIKEIQKTMIHFDHATYDKNHVDLFHYNYQRIELQIWDTTRQERFRTIPDFPSRFIVMLYMHSFSFLTMVGTCNTHVWGFFLLQQSVEQWESRLRVMSPTKHLSTISCLMQLSKARKKKGNVEMAKRVAVEQRVFMKETQVKKEIHTIDSQNINNKFSVKYYLNLFLVDEEDRCYIKQKEMTLYRLKEEIF
ncbi:hypothetical protein HID58_090812, partial [Brassica napus]